jgi:hypothetical protein
MIPLVATMYCTMQSQGFMSPLTKPNPIPMSRSLASCFDRLTLTPIGKGYKDSRIQCLMTREIGHGHAVGLHVVFEPQLCERLHANYKQVCASETAGKNSPSLFPHKKAQACFWLPMVPPRQDAGITRVHAQAKLTDRSQCTQ